MSSGVVISATPRRVGDALTVDVAAGATVLPVADAGDFSEDFTEPRFLVIGESTTPLEYIEVVNDDDATQQTVTLADPAPEGYEAGLPVTLWDPTADDDNRRVVEMTVWVRLDDQPDSPGIEATIPHNLIPLAGVYTLVGASVTVTEDAEGEWWVEAVLGRTPVIDSGYLRTPGAVGILNVDEAWPAGTWQTVKNWGAYDLVAITYDFITGVWTFHEDGVYLAIFGASFEENPNLARGVRPRVHFVDGSSTDARMVKLPAVAGITAVEVAIHRRFYAGQGLSFEALQTSGGTLSLLGSNGDLNNRPTEVTIFRTSP